ncbi:MAG: hypothetical protein K6E86_10010 [Bacteroidales bacterium]|nr:hypothetical protein [Bacteroidales bacterium]
MKRILALGIALIAITLSFTSCDEENFQITQKSGNASTSAFDLWCDYNDVATSHDIEWLMMNDDGSFVLYKCLLSRTNETEVTSVQCEIDSVVGTWIAQEEVITLDIQQKDATEPLVKTYNMVEDNTLLKAADQGDEQEFELIISKDQEVSRSELSGQILNIFKNKQSKNQQLLQATTLILSETTNEQIQALIDQKLAELNETDLTDEERQALAELIEELRAQQEQ